MLDGQGAGVVVADEEDGTAALPGVVAGDDRAVDLHRIEVPVGVDSTAAAAAGAAGSLRVSAPAQVLVVGHDAVEHDPRHPDAAERSAVGAGAAAEGVLHDVDGPVLVLAKGTDGCPAQVWPRRVAAVVDEPRVDHRELAAAVEDGAATAAVEELPG